MFKLQESFNVILETRKKLQMSFVPQVPEGIKDTNEAKGQMTKNVSQADSAPLKGKDHNH